MYTGGTGQSNIEVTRFEGDVEAGRVTALPEPVIMKVGWISSEIVNTLRFHGLETISATQRGGQGTDSYLKSPWYSCVHVVVLRTVTQSLIIVRVTN